MGHYGFYIHTWNSLFIRKIMLYLYDIIWVYKLEMNFGPHDYLGGA